MFLIIIKKNEGKVTPTMVTNQDDKIISHLTLPSPEKSSQALWGAYHEGK